MREINRHILINGLANLPVQKAPERIWENIDAMITTFPTEILPVHKPPTSSWLAIKAGIRSSTFHKRMVDRSIAVIFLLLIIGGSIYYFNGKNNFQHDETKVHSTIISSEDVSLTTTDKNYIAKNDNKASQNSIHVGDNIIESETNTLNFNSTKSITLTVNNVHTDIEGVSENNNVSAINGKVICTQKGELIVGQSVEENEKMKPVIIQNSLIPIHAISISANYSNLDDYYNNLSDNDRKKITGKHGNNFQYCDFNRIEKCVLLGAGIGYQYFPESSIPENTKIKYWLSGDFRVRFKRERLFFETGIGFAFSADKSNFSYNYLTNEMVDTYEYVDSVHYDPITGTTEYFTTTVEVFDSIPHSSTSSVEKDYTYLQFPLLIGYDIIESNSFCLNINVGVVYTVEISSIENIPTLYHENSRITSVQPNYILRNDQLINISGGIGVDWHMSNKLLLNLNSSFNYYFNSIHKNTNNLNNISTGMRLGLLYKL